MRDEEENVHTEDDNLPQAEETGSQRCVTDDVSQKRKYISAGLCCALFFVCYLRTFVDARLITFKRSLFRLSSLYVLKRTL